MGRALDPIRVDRTLASLIQHEFHLLGEQVAIVAAGQNGVAIATSPSRPHARKNNGTCTLLSGKSQVFSEDLAVPL
jgi:hypothetical protein